MSAVEPSLIRRILSLEIFEQLQQLLQQIAKKSESIIITEKIFALVEFPQEYQSERFTILVSDGFSVILSGCSLDQGKQTEEKLNQLYVQEEINQVDHQPAQPNFTSGTDLLVGLSFDCGVIATEIKKLNNILINFPPVQAILAKANLMLTPNNATIQAEFTLSLIKILSDYRNPTMQPNIIETPTLVYQSIEDTLRQQVEQERLLNQVTTQIRQSLELPVILETAVQQVRSFLQVDRLLIYQLNAPPIVTDQQVDWQTSLSNSEFFTNFKSAFCGISQPKLDRITYEARANDTIISVLNLVEDEQCFLKIPNGREKYSQGLTVAIEDVDIAYSFSPCLLEVLQRNQVKAKLIVPIIVTGKLWGMLIAHQCFTARQWEDNEKKFLQQIAAHLAVAIHQAELYAQLQQQKETLEQRVIERTQDLHDALLAAQAANLVKNEFLATMSHELRTPLTCVIGMSATLLRWSFGQLSQRQRNYLQTIHNSGAHLLELINNILELSQMEAGKTVLKMGEFSLSKLARQSLQTFQEKAAEAVIELGIELQIDPTKDQFWADQRRVKQILFNLLSNGIKFTPAHGKVTLRVWVENNYAVFQVEDTGIGIPEQQRSLLFQKFQQLEMSYHRKYEGMGLGLALTKQLVELHNGWIEVDSTVDLGSTFTVWLPNQLAVNPMITSAPTGASTNSNYKGSIVLIEEDEETAWLVCDLLTSAGYQVVWMVEGSTALKQIRLLKPNLAIASMNLPEYEGDKLIRQLSLTTPNLKILVLTNNSTPAEIAVYQSAGADDYLIQPVEPEDLLDKITNLIEDRAYDLGYFNEQN